MPNYPDTVTPILQEIGIELKNSFGSVAAEKKSDDPTDLVTELDRKAEKFIASHLTHHYPDIKYFGEEFGGSLNADRLWILDPIDGTSHYVRGNPYCTTMLVLIENNQPVFSAINNFISGEIYIAQAGKGATKNGKPISVSTRSLDEAYLSHEVNTTIPTNEKFLTEMNRELPLSATVSAGYEYCQVAEGKMEGRITIDAFGGIYDYAPGALLVKEAGGIVRNLNSETYDYTDFSFTATNPKIYEELQEKAYWQDMLKDKTP